MKAATIKAVRERLGLTQPEFALLCHTHPITVSHWENEKRFPDSWQELMIGTLHRERPEPLDIEVVVELKRALQVGAPAAYALLWGKSR